MAYVYLKSTDSLMTSQQDGGIIITSLAGSGTISRHLYRGVHSHQSSVIYKILNYEEKLPLFKEIQLSFISLNDTLFYLK